MSSGWDIHPSARIECDTFDAGPGLVVRKGANIYGRHVTLGRECFIDEHAVIGGGSAGDLTAGDWLHMGMFSQVNTARPVVIGDEVGLGIATRIFTHGAYLSEWDGYPVDFAPVTIGDHVWLPNAQVMPGVTIGSRVVAAAGSVITSDVRSDVLVAGAPAAVKRDGWPQPSDRTAVLERIVQEARCGQVAHSGAVQVGATWFDVAARTIAGPADGDTERMRNQLRRHGIRFRYEPADGQYRAWA